MTIAINELVLCSFHPNVVLPVSEECILLLKKRNVYFHGHTSFGTGSDETEWEGCMLYYCAAWHNESLRSN